MLKVALSPRAKDGLWDPKTGVSLVTRADVGVITDPESVDLSTIRRAVASGKLVVVEGSLAPASPTPLPATPAIETAVLPETEPPVVTPVVEAPAESEAADSVTVAQTKELVVEDSEEELVAMCAYRSKKGHACKNVALPGEQFCEKHIHLKEEQ